MALANESGKSCATSLRNPLEPRTLSGLTKGKKLVDAAFGFQLGDSSREMTASPREAARLQKRGVEDLIRHLESQGGSVRYSGPVSRYIKNKVKTPYARVNGGANTIFRLASQDSQVEIVKIEGSTQFILRLCG